jgi:hypothetical protein
MLNRIRFVVASWPLIKKPWGNKRGIVRPLKLSRGKEHLLSSRSVESHYVWQPGQSIDLAENAAQISELRRLVWLGYLVPFGDRTRWSLEKDLP